MGKSLVTPYAALGVGLAIVLTFGLGAISSVMEQPSRSQLIAPEPEPMPMAPSAPALEAPVQPETEEVVGSRDDRAKEAAPAATGGTAPGEAMIEKVPAKKEEIAKESYSVAAEVPASPFAGFLVALPYIAAAVAGSVVFFVTRKRVGL